jgi:cyclic beta-1,2-glucan synthetase
MATGVILGLGVSTIAALANPVMLAWLVPFALVWVAAPALARTILRDGKREFPAA